VSDSTNFYLKIYNLLKKLLVSDINLRWAFVGISFAVFNINAVTIYVKGKENNNDETYFYFDSSRMCVGVYV
jgi:hypothetical protein